MSSIYRKGRDGYFYYQTYIHNEKTGKKDKRIFHSLGTKSRSEAELKKSKLDVKYKTYLRPPEDRLRGLSNFFTIKNMTIIFVTIFLTSLINAFLENISKPGIKVSEKIMTKKLNHKISPPITSQNASSENIPEKVDSLQKFNLQNKKEKIVSGITTPIEDPPIINYDIQRIDRVSDSFKQGKIYITIDANTSDQSQLAICRQLKDQFTEFSNIIICLYSDNTAGKQLAQGIKKGITFEDQKQNWLALYTYNTVEGEYFDELPNRYLGFN